MSSRTFVNPVDVMALHAKGYTYAEAADALGVKPNTIYVHARDLGLTFHRKPHPTRVPDDLRAEVRRLYATGWTQGDIARKVGRSQSWVGKLIRGER